ncbi:MAG TPA: hypothetical protein VK395_12680 [Gemmataceae bacterium]|nr:hypothetical protein [Gemmataceae bacterium]
METRCERQGQTEIGIIEHEGREFAALGATVNGRHVTAYTKCRNGRLLLTSWCGKTILGCRSEIVEMFWDDSVALLFRLTHRRFIAGYALGENGMLFRGELLTDTDEEEAKAEALRLSDYFAELDAEDEATSD